MLRAYFKSIKDFSLIGSNVIISSTLCDGTSSKLECISVEENTDVNKFIGQWCIVDREVYFCTEAEPKDNSITLTLENPIYAFSRPIQFSGEDTFGALIASGITSGYINGGGDNEYKMPYLSVSNSDSTAYTADADDYNYISLVDVMESAKAEGVKLTFNISGDHSQYLTLYITHPAANELPIVFNDGHHILKSESYDTSFVSKVTVCQVQEDESFVSVNYYLQSDGSISTSAPDPRIDGAWAVKECTSSEDTEEAAYNVFSENKASHKIEFSSDRLYSVNQKIRLRLHNEVFSTEITCREKNSKDDWYIYSCGDLKTTLTQKLKSINVVQPTVNGKSGNVLLTAEDVKALPDSTVIPSFSPTQVYTPTLTNTSTGSVQYYKVGNVVTVQYDFRLSSANSNLTVFTLPSGFRPLTAFTFPCATLGSSAVVQNLYCTISTAGVFKAYSSSSNIRQTGVITFATSV